MLCQDLLWPDRPSQDDSEQCESCQQANGDAAEARDRTGKQRSDPNKGQEAHFIGIWPVGDSFDGESDCGAQQDKIVVEEVW